MLITINPLIRNQNYGRKYGLSKGTNEIIKNEFEDAKLRSEKLSGLSTDVQLELYGFYKQALFGDVTGDRPGRRKVRARAKYDAWTSRKGMSKQTAMREYVKLINKLENSLKK